MSSRMFKPPMSFGMTTVSSRMNKPPSLTSFRTTALRDSAKRAASISSESTHVSSRMHNPPSSISWTVAFEGAGSGSRSVVGFALTSAPLKSPLYPSSLTLTESENMLIMSPHASFVQIVIVGSGLAVLVPSSSSESTRSRANFIGQRRSLGRG